MTTILAISDLQIPFQARHALRFLCEVRDKYKPDFVVNVGDEVDNCALSKYPKDPNGESAGTELKRARRILKGFYEEFPDMRICESNHRERLYKRAYEAGIPKEYLADVHDYLKAPDTWEWAKTWTINGIVFEHGDRASGASTGEKLIDANHASTVYGHHHNSPGVQYRKVADKLYFAMNVGCLIDENTYAMSYTRDNRKKPVLSCGVIVDGVPHLVPMQGFKKKLAVKDKKKKR